MQLFKRRSRMGNDDILISCLAYGLSFWINLQQYQALQKGICLR